MLTNNRRYYLLEVLYVHESRCLGMLFVLVSLEMARADINDAN